MIVLTSANLVMKRDWVSINGFNPVTEHIHIFQL